MSQASNLGTSKRVRGEGKGKGKKAKEEDILEAPAGLGRTPDDDVQAAIISINRMDILAPVLPLTFGAFNNRPLNEKQATMLLDSMRREGFSPFKFQNMIPLVLERDAIDPKCLHATMHDLDSAPMLQLSAAGKAAGMIIAAGGRHRLRAIEMEREHFLDRVEQLKTRIEQVEKAKPEETERVGDRQEKVNKLKERLMEAEERLEKVGIWGVIVYDAGELSDIDAARGGTYNE